MIRLARKQARVRECPHLPEIKPACPSDMTTPSPTHPRPLSSDRLQSIRLDRGDRALPDDTTDLVRGLKQSPKAIPSRYFYDDRGSQLFEQICTLPEYYLTRTETAILERYAGDIARATGACELLELGSGSSTKTRLLIDAYSQLGATMSYVPIDVSAAILEDSARQLLADYPTLHICGLVGTYEQALAALPPSALPTRTFLFIGSSLGNFPPDQSDRFFTNVVAAMEAGDYFLLGIDLQKEVAVMEAAYNDRQGVTAEFNFNLLEHLNRRYQGDFQRDRFEHWSFYSPERAQIETYLRAKEAQTVRLDALDLTVEFEAGETIHTEVSRKFDLAEMKVYLAEQGLPCVRVWSDDRQWFALLLCQRA